MSGFTFTAPSSLVVSVPEDAWYGRDSRFLPLQFEGTNGYNGFIWLNAPPRGFEDLGEYPSHSEVVGGDMNSLDATVYTISATSSSIVISMAHGDDSVFGILPYGTKTEKDLTNKIVDGLTFLAPGSGSPTLTDLYDSGTFLTDGVHLYYVKRVNRGWVTRTIDVGESSLPERVTDVVSTIELVPNGDPATFKVLATTLVTSNTAQPQVVEIHAEDAGQTYTFQSERWGCMGDVSGCLGNETLTKRGAK